ncbi:integrase core domain-containing protein [Nocardiopsis alkaliphila]|uniref:integrase core domain-containing protein n=1 Tax=Nocardiopsis alkaliphila TaxID=225762 RepID=UPI0012696D5A|nr:integrase core domain-containing protein [Nocardiopsis alkaliphila]
MTSKEVCQLLLDLGLSSVRIRGPRTPITRTPRRSQDPRVRAYPDRFASLAHAREWLEGFMAYYDHEHRHSGIGYHSPASVHFGTAGQVREQRARALDQAYAAHPERFSRRPEPPRLPETVWINDPARRSDPTPQIV